ncbi:AAA family ATPase, partial [Actinoplanes sp. NPDC051633]|uniref:helix-turn-helix transcriptional regulator n=1 Tax=Actinoplanes sp. NPDC051633 TaxID=3155670 RepID=UPI00341B26F9
FVGRRAELGVLDEALRGGYQLVLVVGDAGLGKTRLVAEAMDSARQRGAVTVACGCLPLADKLPLLPAVHALHELDRLGGGRVLAGALDHLPGFVRAELARLLPQLGDESPGASGQAQLAGREQLFAAFAALLVQLAGEAPVVLLVEDIHWADSATLDLLTCLRIAAAGSALVLVVTCRSDEASVEEHILSWLAQVRRSTAIVEVRLIPLSRDEVAEQAADLAGGAPSAAFVDRLHARAQGNPFYVEQLMAAALTRPAAGDLELPRRLPGGLTDLLTGRVRQVSDAARAVLAGLAVAERPLTEPSLAAVTGLPEPAVRPALGELSAAKLLAPFDDDGGGCRPRHALLAEAVTAGLLPGERLSLHARTAMVLEATGDPAVMAEVAGHWAAAGRPADELRATVAAAEAALQVFAFGQAADLWLRAIDLSQRLPDAAARLNLDPAGLHLSAIDALGCCGRREEAARLTEQTYHRFAAWPDRAIAARVHSLTGSSRSIDDPAAARPLYDEALRLFTGTPASREHAESLLHYANGFRGQGQSDAGLSHLDQALVVAEAAGATDVAIIVLANLARLHIVNGRLDDAFASLQRGNDLVRSLQSPSADAGSGGLLAAIESDLLLKTGRPQEARDVGLEGYERAKRIGRGESVFAIFPLSNAVEAILELGDTAEAARLLDPLTSDGPRLDTWPLHACRVQLDLRRGRVEQAAKRLDTIRRLLPALGDVDFAREIALVAVELALWRSEPQAALAEAEQVLARLHGTEQELLCGELLVLGARAAADLALRARAKGDRLGEGAADAALQRLASILERMGGRPFTEHPYAVRIPGDRAEWTAERSRGEGVSHPAAWEATAAEWEALGRPHRAGYAWWRHAQARLEAGQSPSTVAGPLRRAAASAAGMAPLAEAIEGLARRARISLQATDEESEHAAVPLSRRYGLTARELLVLRLVADGRTNAQIGAELYMSPKTASVHVSNILRKLRVTNRVQAAALAERAGILEETPNH